MSLVGPIGTGKTTTLALLNDLGYSTMKENYIDCDINGIDNRYLISKWNWIANWFTRVIKFSKSSGDQLLLSDRSPIEAGLWTERCFPLMEALRRSFDELRLLNINCKHIYLKCDKEILWRRVQERLRSDPHRMQYNESNKDFFTELVEAYDKYNSLWDNIVDTSYIEPKEVAQQIISLIKGANIHESCQNLPVREY